MSVEVKGMKKLCFCHSYKEVSSNYNIKAQDDIIGVDSSSGAITVTLPAATVVSGNAFYIKNLGPNTVIVDAYGDEQIDQAPSVSLATQDASLTVASTGKKWIII